jgi:hypothetical protein
LHCDISYLVSSKIARSQDLTPVLQAIVYPSDKLRRAMVARSNSVVKNWGKYLWDVPKVSTILDRLMHRCTLGRPRCNVIASD